MRKSIRWTVSALAVVTAVIGGVTASGEERHQQIRAAQRALANAEQHLGQAAHDYGGHRVKAMELIRSAQAELREGLAWDRTHEGKKGSAGAGSPPQK